METNVISITLTKQEWEAVRDFLKEGRLEVDGSTKEELAEACKEINSRFGGIEQIANHITACLGDREEFQADNYQEVDL